MLNGRGPPLNTWSWFQTENRAGSMILSNERLVVLKRQSFHFFLTKKQTSSTNQRLLFWYSPSRRLWADFCRGRFCIALHRGYNRFCNNQFLTTIRADVQNAFLHRSFRMEFSADQCPRGRLSRLQRSLARSACPTACPSSAPGGLN